MLRIHDASAEAVYAVPSCLLIFSCCGAGHCKRSLRLDSGFQFLGHGTKLITDGFAGTTFFSNRRNVTKLNRLIRFVLLSSAILGLPVAAISQQDAALRSAIQRVVDTSRARVGVAIEGLDFRDSIVLNGERKYPMQSTYKFPLALCVLYQIEQGRYTLATKVHIAKSDLDTNTMSPMSRKYFGESVDLSIDELLNYCVSESDNIACDLLFKYVGGTHAVNDYVHSLGVSEIAIVATERQMRKSWSVQYSNWCKPAAMLGLL